MEKIQKQKKKSKRIKLTREQERLWRTLLFLIRLAILSIPLYLVISLGIDLSILQNAVASQSAMLLSLMGFEVEQDGILIKVGKENPFSFIIDEDCTGWKSMLFLFALIFAVPKIQLKKRLFGFLAGIPIIWIGNLLRVIGVVLVERQSGVEFALMVHDFGFRLGLVALVLGIWYAWFIFVSGMERKIKIDRDN